MGVSETKVVTLYTYNYMMKYYIQMESNIEISRAELGRPRRHLLRMVSHGDSLGSLAGTAHESVDSSPVL